MDNFSKKTIHEIVEENYQASAVLEKYGIRFYEFKKDELLTDLCSSLKIDCGDIEREISEILLLGADFNNLPLSGWKLEFLIQYIKHVHHDYENLILRQLEVSILEMRQSCEEETQLLEMLSRSIRRLKLAVTANNLHEEDIIFPYIRQMENLANQDESFGLLFVRTLRKPLDLLEKGHRTVMDIMSELRNETLDFDLSVNDCPRIRFTFRQLKDLYHKLLEHKFLENNVLFPKAMEIESRLLKQYPC